MLRNFSPGNRNNSTSFSLGYFTSNNQNQSVNRWELGVSKNKGLQLSGKKNAMSRMQLFQSPQNCSPFYFSTQREKIILGCQKVLKLKPSVTKTDSHQQFKVQKMFYQNMPQIADMNSDNYLFIGTKQGVQIMRNSDYIASCDLRDGNNLWSTQIVKFQDNQTAAIGCRTGTTLLFDAVCRKVIHKYKQKKSPCENMKSFVWDNNVLYQGSELWVKSIDTRVRKNLTNDITLSSHCDAISTMSLEENTLAVAHRSGTLAFFDIRRQKKIKELTFSEPSLEFFVEWCPWNSRSLLGCRDKSLFEISSLSDFKITRQVEMIQGFATGMKCLPINQSIVISENDSVYTRDKRFQITGELNCIKGQQTFTSLGACQKKNTVYAFSRKSFGYVWDVPHEQREENNNTQQVSMHW